MMSRSQWFFLSALFVLVHPEPVLGQSCSQNCKTCGGPEGDHCLRCHAGFGLHDTVCVDIDECGTELGQCPQNTYCLNAYGSFECRACDPACLGCMGGGPARCRTCAHGYRSSGMKCLDVDECSEEVLACPGLNVFCVNTEGSFRCQCAEGFSRKGSSCERNRVAAGEEKGLFDDIQDEEIEVLQQMFFGVVLCALATLAAKGDMVFTSMFMGAVAAMAGYWLSDRSDRVMNTLIRGR